MFWKSKKNIFMSLLRRSNGSVLITLIVIMVIFAILAAAMYSLTTSSMFGHIHTLSTTKASYIAKSGYNYLASQYKNTTGREAQNLALDALHGQTFQLRDNGGSFNLNIKPYYFESLTSDTSLRSGNTVRFKFPGAVTYSFTVGQTGAMAVYTPSGYGWFNYRITSVAANDYTLQLTSNARNIGNTADLTTPVSIGTSIVPLLMTPANNQTFRKGGNLTVTGAGNIYPARFGFFEIPQVDTTHVYYYNNRTGDTFYDTRDAQDSTRDFTYTVNNRRVCAHTSAEITSIGTVNPGLGPAVSSTFSRPAIFGFNAGAGNPHNIPGVGGWVTVDTGVYVDTANDELQLGRSQTGTTGAAWYAGDSEAANCATGKCDFGTGIRAFFQFRDTASGSNKGDGFVFVIMNGTNNNTGKRGGLPSGVGMGELLGYAGAGNTTDGLGLQPPKIGIEFDLTRNYTSTGNGCNEQQREDANHGSDPRHIALMFWGDNTTSNCSGGTPNDGFPAASYDDNIHGVPNPGTPSTPRNSFSGDGTGGYTQPTSNYSTTHSVRVEITRATTVNANGNYDYNIQLWLWRGNCDGTGCSDLSIAFTDTSDRKINRTAELASDLHSDFDKMIFGFTQATGDWTQYIHVTNFDIYFP